MLEASRTADLVVPQGVTENSSGTLSSKSAVVMQSQMSQITSLAMERLEVDGICSSLLVLK